MAVLSANETLYLVIARGHANKTFRIIGGDDVIEIINVRPIKEVRHFNSIYVKDFETVKSILIFTKGLSYSNVRKNIYDEYILDRKDRYEVSVRCTNTDFDPVIEKYGLIEIGRRRGNRYFVLSNEETRCE